ncbi:hypothetical protein KAR91_18065 [Candidatus Pacearchaeota archaeon]|nr:hypothetical protein [Candidatus Pacearchaeota archaeon]
METNTGNERYIIFASDESPPITISYLQACNIQFKQVVGYDAGISEPSFIVNRKNFYKCLLLVENQKLVLELSQTTKNGSRIARLCFTDTYTCVVLGYFEQVTQEEAEKGESYTFDPTTGAYFIAK